MYFLEEFESEVCSSDGSKRLTWTKNGPQNIVGKKRTGRNVFGISSVGKLIKFKRGNEVIDYDGKNLLESDFFKPMTKVASPPTPVALQKQQIVFPFTHAEGAQADDNHDDLSHIDDIGDEVPETPLKATVAKSPSPNIAKSPSPQLTNIEVAPAPGVSSLAHKSHNDIIAGYHKMIEESDKKIEESEKKKEQKVVIRKGLKREKNQKDIEAEPTVFKLNPNIIPNIFARYRPDDPDIEPTYVFSYGEPKNLVTISELTKTYGNSIFKKEIVEKTNKIDSEMLNVVYLEGSIKSIDYIGGSVKYTVQFKNYSDMYDEVYTEDEGLETFNENWAIMVDEYNKKNSAPASKKKSRK